MSSEPKIPMTPGCFERLKQELKQIREHDRAENVRDIEVAREHGDLRENAEYHAAKEDQGLLEARIAKLEEVLANARIIDSSQMDTSKVYIHCTVKVRHVTTDAQKNFTLVAESESDIKTGKISVSSPIGKGLLGKAVGDVAEVLTPAGSTRFEIIEITR